MANINATATEILGGAIELIQEHGYNPGVERDGDAYSIPAAFDEVVYGEPHTMSQMPLMMLGIPADFPEAYFEAKRACMQFADPVDPEPKTQERAVEILQAGLDYLTEQTAA